MVSINLNIKILELVPRKEVYLDQVIIRGNRDQKVTIVDVITNLKLDLINSKLNKINPKY
jgi:hypothetical protein